MWDLLRLSPVSLIPRRLHTCRQKIEQYERNSQSCFPTYIWVWLIVFYRLLIVQTASWRRLLPERTDHPPGECSRHSQSALLHYYGMYRFCLWGGSQQLPTTALPLGRYIALWGQQMYIYVHINILCVNILTSLEVQIQINRWMKWINVISRPEEVIGPPYMYCHGTPISRLIASLPSYIPLSFLPHSDSRRDFPAMCYHMLHMSI